MPSILRYPKTGKVIGYSQETGGMADWMIDDIDTLVAQSKYPGRLERNPYQGDQIYWAMPEVEMSHHTPWECLIWNAEIVRANIMWTNVNNQKTRLRSSKSL
jgi:hypothetical protein